jgi:hypothetical protein
MTTKQAPDENHSVLQKCVFGIKGMNLLLKYYIGSPS